MASFNLPHELYSMIIRFATYSPVCFDISPDPQSWSVDCPIRWCQADYKTKKALTLVSRQFRSLSLPFLYEAVEIHKVSSMKRLADVLDITSSGSTTRGPQNPRQIKHLFVSVLDVKEKTGSIIVLSNLRRVFLHCQHLVGFGFYTTSLDWAALGAKARNFLVSIPPGVRFLDWKGPKLGCNFSLIIKRICQSLIALRCSLVELRTPLPSVSFPKLTHFYLPVGPGVSGVLCDWQMPALTHLYVSGVMNNSVIAVIIRSRVTLRCVVREHGATPELIVQIPKVTPNLEEFTYHLRDGMELFWKSVRTHSSLQDIVVVIQHFISRGIYQAPSVSALCTHLQPLTKAHFPKLRGVTIVGLKIHSLHAQKRAPLDAILDAWNTFGIEAKFYDP